MGFSYFYFRKEQSNEQIKNIATHEDSQNVDQ